MPSGQDMLNMAREHIGERYENVLVPKNNPNWHGPWDCAEFMSWLVFQAAGILYGCLDDTVPPAVADAYTGGWERDSLRLGTRVPIDQAASTVGGIVLRFPPAPGKMGHIAICDGAGGTVEAKGHAFGVVADVVHGRNWNTGVLVPHIQYDAPVNAVQVTPPTHLYALGAPNMTQAKISEIQSRLAMAGFDPGPIDGIFGHNTVAAVAAFQRSAGLVVDGQVGPQTAAALGIDLG
jgi:N-acetylmuramoyl-L-alanine amidase